MPDAYEGVATNQAADGDTPGPGGVAQKIEVAPEDETPMKLTSLLISQKFSEYKEMLMDIGFKNKVTVQKTEEGLLVDVTTNDIFRGGDPNQVSPKASVFIQSIANAVLSLNREFKLISMPVMGGDEQPLAPVVLSSEKQVDTLRKLFVEKYRIPLSGITGGLSFKKKNNKDSVIRFLLADRKYEIENINSLLKNKTE